MIFIETGIKISRIWNVVYNIILETVLGNEIILKVLVQKILFFFF
jgi:hypothetical protein